MQTFVESPDFWKHWVWTFLPVSLLLSGMKELSEVLLLPFWMTSVYHRSLCLSIRASVAMQSTVLGTCVHVAQNISLLVTDHMKGTTTGVLEAKPYKSCDSQIDSIQLELLKHNYYQACIWSGNSILIQFSAGWGGVGGSFWPPFLKHRQVFTWIFGSKPDCYLWSQVISPLITSGSWEPQVSRSADEGLQSSHTWRVRSTDSFKRPVSVSVMS